MQQLPTWTSFPPVSFKSSRSQFFGLHLGVSQAKPIQMDHLPSPTPGFSNTINGFTTPSHSVIYASNFQNVLHIALSINHIQIITTFMLILATNSNSISLPFPPPLNPSASGFYSATLHHALVTANAFALCPHSPSFPSPGYVREATG